MKKTTKPLVDIIILHIISILSIALYIFSTALLYPIGYFSHVIFYFIIFSVLGVFFIYKKPNITKNLFITTVIGAFLTVLSYILTTEQDWTIFTFIFVLLSISCILLLFLATYFLKKDK